MKIHPIGKWLILKPSEREHTAKDTGLDMPVDYEDRPEEGLVLAVGNEVKDIQVGQVACYSKIMIQYGAIPYWEDGIYYWIMNECDFMGVK